MDRATTPTRKELDKIIAEHANAMATIPVSATALAPNAPPPLNVDPRAELIALALGSPEFQHK